MPLKLYACHVDYDSNGNLTVDTSCNLYFYNAQNELISFKNMTTHKRAFFSYNSEGLLEEKAILSKHRLYIYNSNGKLINSLIKAQSLATAYLTRGERIVVDNHIASEQYLISDALGTNYLQLNSHSEISQHFNYQSFGALVNFAGGDAKDGTTSFDALPLLYHGQYLDRLSDLIYLHSRFYNPKLIRFIQRDNYSLLNRYNYVNSNPINNTDPSGHMSFGLMDMIAGTGFALATSVVTALSPEFSYMAASFFVASNSAPAGMDMTLDLLHHKFLSGVSNALLMLSGVAGSISAQPEMMLPSVRKLAAGEIERDSADGIAALDLKDRYQTFSSTISSILGGAASGLANPYISSHNGGIYNSAAISAITGFASGQFYGYLSNKLGKNENVWKNALLGSIRSGISGIINASPVLISQELAGKKFTLTEGLSQGIPFLFGGISGLSQNYLRDAYQNSSPMRLAVASMFRTGYLSIRAPIGNAVSSGTLNTLFSN
ncbi:RHS repeat domain-containing protein [Cysteiniphilum marinum]|nr:RHS repeat-associated core domain-containing protein [Cysteiniphilum marinum]